MKILFISYGIKEYDGRMKELLKVCSNIGNTVSVYCSNYFSERDDEIVVLKKNNKYMSISLYFKFIIRSICTLVKRKNDIIFIDNLYASSIGLFIKIIMPTSFVVQDCRELYFRKSVPNISGKIFCWFEEQLMKRADVVICANEERAEIMKNHYKLYERPLIFENIRILEGKYDEQNLNQKYKSNFSTKYNLICSGGYSILRKTDILVKSMKELGSEYTLHIVGGGAQKERDLLNRIIKENSITNVFFIEKVPMEELKYIVQQCDIGIVNYHENDLNNKYCASGKIYEYLNEGLPIVTTENIPLKNFCDTTQTGISDNSFSKGIKEVSKNIEIYKNNVQLFNLKFSVENNNMRLTKQILDYYTRVKKG